ncbi:MAG: enoyl-CoA hydratase/isomerase family protein [Firmicutes bacterium]|nr:enoyl-CoA hydratase/isomerase family protein [Bacillota bacterium]
MNDIVFEKKDRIARIELHRPAQLNAMNTEMISALLSIIEDVSRARDIWVVVINGNERSFSTGADLKERATLSESQWHDQHYMIEELFFGIRHLPQPLLAAVSGWALAGGAELALSCDVIIADHSARFGQPEVKRGLMPGAGGTQLMLRRLPRGLASYLLFSGQTITAQEAHSYGLVTFLVESDPVQKANEIAHEIIAASPTAVQAAKRAMRLGVDQPLDVSCQIELECWYRTILSGENQEGARAFREGRAPVFRNPL